MSEHLFAINCHKDDEQVGRLCTILSKHFHSNIIVYHDGPPGNICTIEGTILSPYQPDKCRSLCEALNALLAYAERKSYNLVSFLHGDMVPTDRPQFERFLRRFEASGKAVTHSPMLRGHHCVSFCNLHFRLPEAMKLFPITNSSSFETVCRINNMWFNEYVTTASWDENWPAWRSHAYPMGLLNHPHQGGIRFADGTFCDKLIHGPDFEYTVADYVPESSVIHSHDPRFWESYERFCRQ